VTAVPVLRAATVEDLDAIAALMRASVLAIFPGFYDERQTASAAVHIAHVDPMLVADNNEQGDCDHEMAQHSQTVGVHDLQ
jgi:hypothetical protein